MLSKTILNKFYQVAFRNNIYIILEEFQKDIIVWIKSYNEESPPMISTVMIKTFLQTKPHTKDKMLGNDLAA
jgi:hypothetical protein